MSPSKTCGLATLLSLLTACVQTAGPWVADAGALPARNSVPVLSAIQGESPVEPEQAAEEDEEPFKRHTVSLVTRVVTEERSEGGPAIGLDYEYRFHESWGASAFAEYVAGDLDVGVFGAMGNFHATERLLIGIGPGFETNKEETRALMRLGGLYEFEAGEFFVAPAVYWDWLEGGDHVFVFGLNFSTKF